MSVRQIREGKSVRQIREGLPEFSIVDFESHSNLVQPVIPHPSPSYANQVLFEVALGLTLALSRFKVCFLFGKV